MSNDKGYDVIPKSQHPADPASFYDQMEAMEGEAILFSKRDIATLALFAHFFGWRRTNAKGLVLAAPDQSKTITLPISSNLNSKVFRAQANTIVRHGIRGYNLPMYEVVDALAVKAKLNHDQVRVLRQAVDSYTGPTVVAESDSDDKGSFDPEVSPPAAARAVYISLLEPWTAHGRPKGEASETYPSEAVMERTWSDGHQDYSCRFEDCEFTSDNPRSVASHFASKHRRGAGKAPQPEADGLDMDWTPTQATRIRRLKRELDGALAAALAQGHDINDTEWIAAWIITHRIEGLSGDTTLTEDEGPLTAEQILDKIAALADRGRAHVLREQVETLNTLLDESEAARQTEAQRRERAEGSLTALRELINETGEQ